MKLYGHIFSPLFIIGIIAGLLVISAGITVAANSSKPGDTLYGIDRGAEKLQLALAFTDDDKKETHAVLAVERLDELEDLYTEGQLNASGISDALSNFEEHETQLAELSGSDGTFDGREEELTQSVELKKSYIDNLAEDQQKSLESQREALKKQYEQLLKNGDTAKAAAIRLQIDSFESLLKDNEEQREAQKQELEEQSEAAKKAEELQKKEAEEQSEAEKKAQEQEDH